MVFMDCITYMLSSFSKWNYSTKKVEEIFQCDSDLNISLLLFFFSPMSVLLCNLTYKILRRMQ